jgi:predicted phage terminase large subunit-like protein
MIVGIDEEQNIWVMEDLVWARLATDDVVERMIDLMEKYKPLYWWAERGHISKSIGPFLYRRMRERNVFCAISEVTPVHDKRTRAQSIMGRIAMEMVYFPSSASWWMEARQEMLQFPLGVRDDFVDTLAWVGNGLTVYTAPVRAKTVKPPVKTMTLGWVKEQSLAARKRKNSATAQGW